MEACVSYEVCAGATMFDLADTLKKLKDAKAEAEEKVKEINKQIDQVEQELAQTMINDEVQKFSRGGTTFYLSHKVYVNSLADKRPYLHNWLKNNGFKSLVIETVSAPALTKLVSEMLDESDELPDGLRECVSVFEKPVIGIRKSSKKIKGEGLNG